MECKKCDSVIHTGKENEKEERGDETKRKVPIFASSFTGRAFPLHHHIGPGTSIERDQRNRAVLSMIPQEEST